MDKKIGNSYDYRTLRSIINANHDRFSSLNFDDSMSLLQKMNALVEFFKVMLQEYEEWIAYLDEFQDKFDENLYKTVDDILKEWASNGEFAKLIIDSFGDAIKNLDTKVNSINNTKVDKAGVEQVKYTNLSQEVKQMLAGTGSNIPVVGDNSVSTSNIVNNSVTSPKRTVLGEYAEIVGVQPIPVDLINNKIEFSTGGVTHRVYWRGKLYVIPETIINFDENLSQNGINATARLLKMYFNVALNTIELYPHDNTTVDEDNVLIGFISRRINTYTYSFVEMNALTKTIGDTFDNYTTGQVLHSVAPLDFNFDTNKVTISPNTFIVYGSERWNLNNSTNNIELDLGITDSNTIFYIYFDKIARELKFTTQTTNFDNSHVSIGLVRKFGEYNNISINGDYTINNFSRFSRMSEIKYIGSDAIKLDTTTRQLIFPSANQGGNARLFTENNVFELGAENSIVEIGSVAQVGNLVKVWFNVLTQQFSTEAWSTYSKARKGNELLFAVIRLVNPISVSVNGDYYINEKKPANDDSLSTLTNNMEDSINSWWVYPLAKSFKGQRDKMYISYTDSMGYKGIISKDNTTGEIVKNRIIRRDVDDHNAGCLDILPNNKIIYAFSGGHETDTKIHIYISESKESIVKFKMVKEIEIGGSTSYSQLFITQNGIYIFYRKSLNSWGYVKSTDNGINWSTPKTIIVADTQYYVKAMYTSDNNKLKLVTISNPNGTDTQIRHCIFDTNDDSVYTTGNTLLGSENVNKNNIPIAILNESGKKNRLLDVAITSPLNSKIAYAVFSNANDGVYKVYDDTNTYTIANTGAAFYEPSQYFNGMIFVDENTIVLSRGDSGVDKVDEYNFDTEWTKLKELYVDSLAIRPFHIINTNYIGLSIGYYNNFNYTDFLTDFKLLEL